MLKVEGLSKEYKDFKLDNVSFNLEPGYIMGFIGPNGAGKTTTIKLLMNLIKKSSGEVEIFGMKYPENEIKIKDRIGFVYDEASFYDDLPICKMKDIVKAFYSKWSDEKFNHLIDSFGLKQKTKIKELSKGMKMKFSLALALSHDADLIIMDEPTSGLDPVFRREVLDLLRDFIQNENKSIFFSSHITTDLEQVADFVTYINKGKIVFSLPTDKVFEKYKLIKGTTSDITEEVRKHLVGIRETRVGFSGLIESEAILDIRDNENFILEKPTLEDIMYFTKGE